MDSNYDAAWANLKGWLAAQEDYIMIPVAMVRARMNDEERLFNLT